MRRFQAAHGRGSPVLAWAAGALLLALLAWQGHRIAHWLPQIEQFMARLGPWGPLALVTAVLVLGPLFFPDSIFGIASGVTFGLVAGVIYYFVAMYLMCLAVHLASARGLRSRVRRLLASRPRLRAAVRAASRGGTRSVLLVRLIPLNQALLSYALGAAGVPLRAALVGNTAMFVHLLPTVYFGVAAAHVTRMAAGSRSEWEVDGVLLLLGLVACVGLALLVSQRAWAALGVSEDDAGPDDPSGPGRER